MQRPVREYSFDFSYRSSAINSDTFKNSARKNGFTYYLESFVLNEFLESINNKEIVIFVVMSNVSCVKPAIRVNYPRGSLWVVQIT